MNVVAKPWPDLVAFYRGLAATAPWHEPMASFVEELAASPRAEWLFASTSLSTLLLSISPRFERAHEVLRIEAWTGLFKFDFVEAPEESRRWRATCGRKKAMATLDRFIALRGWPVRRDHFGPPRDR